MKPSFVFILMMGICIYMCSSILLWPELLKIRSEHSGWILVAYHTCPWLLACLSIKGWYKSFVWRRMVEARNSASTLSRGDHRFDRQKKRIGILEWLCLLFLLMSVCTLWEIWL